MDTTETHDQAAVLRQELADANEALAAARSTLRSFWRAELDTFTGAIDELAKEPIRGDGGPRLVDMLELLEGGLKEERFGELFAQAEAARLRGIDTIRHKLGETAIFIASIENLPDPDDIPLPALMLAKAMLEMMPLSIDAFFGSEDQLRKATENRKASLAKLESIIEERQRSQNKHHELVSRAAEHRDSAAAMHAIEDASMSSDQRVQRSTRVSENAQELFKLARRITEIAQIDDTKGEGAIDGESLLDVVRTAHALVAKVEGRSN